MDQHALEYYSAYSQPGAHGNFHRVIALHNDPFLEWQDAVHLAPDIPRGWFELAQLPIEDRIEFTREFWRTKLPYHPHLDEFLLNFFATIDDIGVILTQQKYGDPFSSHLIYSLADNSGFFHGESPAGDSEIINLQKVFPNYILPADYLAFLQIHDGFAKLTDTGIIPSNNMKESYRIFQGLLEEGPVPVSTITGESVNPKTLIPFYESFGMPYFQCFWGEWYPEQEMGNVYYSGQTKTITTSKRKDECEETMAFETFIDWLMFYLEKID